jgi:hypothetical protein
MKNTIKDLIEISQYAGDRADYTQGGGGNTSVKNFDNGLMLIKASGYRLVDINETTAFVAVDKNKIENYYNSVDLSAKKDYEKEFKNPAYSTNPRALMEQYGYTIFDLGNLSDKQWQTILATLVEHKLINASATVGYLEDLIKIGKDNPFACIEEENIEKWKTDRDFLSLYQV